MCNEILFCEAAAVNIETRGRKANLSFLFCEFYLNPLFPSNS